MRKRSFRFALTSQLIPKGSARPEGGREAPALGGGSGAARWFPPGDRFEPRALDLVHHRHLVAPLFGEMRLEHEAPRNLRGQRLEGGLHLLVLVLEAAVGGEAPEQRGGFGDALAFIGVGLPAEVFDHVEAA